MYRATALDDCTTAASKLLKVFPEPEVKCLALLGAVSYWMRLKDGGMQASPSAWRAGRDTSFAKTVGDMHAGAVKGRTPQWDSATLEVLLLLLTVCCACYVSFSLQSTYESCGSLSIICVHCELNITVANLCLQTLPYLICYTD